MRRGTTQGGESLTGPQAGRRVGRHHPAHPTTRVAPQCNVVAQRSWSARFVRCHLGARCEQLLNTFAVAGAFDTFHEVMQGLYVDAYVAFPCTLHAYSQVAGSIWK